MRKTALAFSFGPAAAAVLGLIIVPVLAWNYDQADVGRYGLLLVCLQLTTIVTTLGLDQAYVRWFHRAGDKNELFRRCFWPTLICSAIVSIGTYAVLQSASPVPTSSATAAFVALAIVLSAISRMMSLPHRMLAHGWLYSLGQVLPKLIILALIALPLQRTFEGLTFIVTVSLLASSALYYFRRAVDGPAESLGVEHIATLQNERRTLLNYAVPLVPASIIFWTLTAVGPLTLTKLGTLNDVGLYAVLLNIAGVASVLQTIFATLWAPMLFKRVEAGQNLDIIDTATRSIARLTVPAVCAAGAIAPAVAVLLPYSYNDISVLMPAAVLPPLLLMLSEVTGSGIYVQRRTTWALLPPVIGVAFSLGVAIAAVPHLGVAGALIGNLAGYVAFLVVRTEISCRVLRKISRRDAYIAPAVVGVVAGASAALGPDYPTVALIAWLTLAVLTLPSSWTALSHLLRLKPGTAQLASTLK